MRSLLFSSALSSALLGLACARPPAPGPGQPQPTAERATDTARAAASVDDWRSLPAPRSSAPYWTTEVVLSSALPCEVDLDCDLVAPPCECECPSLIRAGERRRRRAERSVAAKCDAAPLGCAACERPANTYRCDQGTCAGVESLLHETY